MGAGADEVLISLDYPDERHDAFREIPGLFARIRSLVGALDARDRRGVVLTSVLQSDNFREALAIARLIWHFYLAYCEAGFRAGSVDVAQFRLEHAA